MVRSEQGGTSKISAFAADKSSMIDFQIPFAGMNSAAASLDRAAVQIAHAADPATGNPATGNPATDNPATDNMDLSAAMVELMQARNDFSANVKVAQTYNEVQQSLLKILG